MHNASFLRRHPGKAFATIVFAAAAFLLTNAIPAAQEAARRTHCRNNLKQIELALHNYHDTFGCFPPAIVYGPDGKPWHSWRVLIAPFIEASPFSAQYSFDEPWNGPNNRRLSEGHNPGPLYRCPTDADSPPEHTSYLAVIGEGTMWPPDGVASFDD